MSWPFKQGLINIPLPCIISSSPPKAEPKDPGNSRDRLGHPVKVETKMICLAKLVLPCCFYIGRGHSQRVGTLWCANHHVLENGLHNLLAVGTQRRVQLKAALNELSNLLRALSGHPAASSMHPEVSKKSTTFLSRKIKKYQNTHLQFSHLGSM